MNLILVEPHELCGNRCTLTDARATHLRTTLHAQAGSTFRIGVTDGPIGHATVCEITDTGAVTCEVNLTEAPLAPWYDLVLALTRPRSLRRILYQSATLGVRNIYLTGATKVEKSYFSMHLLREAEYRPLLLEGLMQAKTTAVPRLTLVPRLRDLWDLLPPDTTARYIANPAPHGTSTPPPGPHPLFAIGPDGGWTPAENEAFAEHDFTPITLGPRPLRTDTAAIALPARFLGEV